MTSICDGTKSAGTRNCHDPAGYKMRVKGDDGPYYWSCGRHIGQVASELLNGEKGEMEFHKITTDED